MEVVKLTPNIMIWELQFLPEAAKEVIVVIAAR